ncbi:MAG: cob(I)yrinic acid a,c-diamide adenosyltransferase [Clostridia bacterium]
METGLIHIYCGDGKGKTTAAVGLGVRCLGRGGRVLFLQFLKDNRSGEIGVLEKISGFRFLRGKPVIGFSHRFTEEQRLEYAAIHDYNIREAVRICREESIDMLVLDEAVGAYALNLLDRQALLHFLKNKPVALEIVLTGRNPAPELTELADYVSEMKKIKHPYDRGIQARRGIEK